MLLMDAGLRTAENIRKELNRFSIGEYLRMLEIISKEMHDNGDKKYFYVIKLVPLKKLYKLPNLLICDETDYNIVKSTLRTMDLRGYDEIWFCKSEHGAIGKYSSGRIFFINESNEISQIIEHVSSSNPRLIEKFRLNSEISYLRAKRFGWGRSYTIEYSQSIDSNIITKWRDILLEIERQRENIEYLEKYFSSLDIMSFSLEYMNFDDGFTFVDWDTSNDPHILNSKTNNHLNNIDIV